MSRERDQEIEGALGMDDLPEVGGRRIKGSLAALERRARILIGEQQRKPNPDNTLIAVLCNTVRLAREYSDSVHAPVAPPCMRKQPQQCHFIDATATDRCKATLSPNA